MTGGLPSLVVSALAIGALAALPLMLGAWLAQRRRLPDRLVGLVAAFGAGALISAITFELVLDAVARGSPVALGFSLAAGAMAYFVASEFLDRRSQSAAAASRGLAILVGAMLDGIPESLILGLSIATGTGRGNRRDGERFRQRPFGSRRGGLCRRRAADHADRRPRSRGARARRAGRRPGLGDGLRRGLRPAPDRSVAAQPTTSAPKRHKLSLCREDSDV